MDVYGLIGSPIEHSLSPVMFEAAFAARETDATYVPFHVETDRCIQAVNGADALEVAGLNVTIPHKETVMEVTAPTQVAQTVGAANLIDFREEPPLADNTDVNAMAAVLDELEHVPHDALVLGAGGAAKAYVHALIEAGWSVTIANRTFERAEAVASRYEDARAVEFSEVVQSVPPAGLIVNATSVGLEEDVSPLDTGVFEAEHTVIDAVYRPQRTRLLTDAHAEGANTISGVTLLLEQAVATYERWRSEPAPRQAMADALERAIDGAT